MSINVEDVETFFEIQRPNTETPNKSDIVIMIIHACLIGPPINFRLIGVGQKVRFNANCVSSCQILNYLHIDAI